MNEGWCINIMHWLKFKSEDKNDASYVFLVNSRMPFLITHDIFNSFSLTCNPYILAWLAHPYIITICAIETQLMNLLLLIYKIEYKENLTFSSLSMYNVLYDIYFIGFILNVTSFGNLFKTHHIPLHEIWYKICYKTTNQANDLSFILK